MAVDSTLLDGGAGLVRVHEISDSMEKTTMRSAGDIAKLKQLQIDEETACNETKRLNVMQNIFGFRARRQSYKS